MDFQPVPVFSLSMKQKRILSERTGQHLHEHFSRLWGVRWAAGKRPASLFKPRRKIISGWQHKLTGQRVPIHSNYVPILLVTLALLLQIGTRPGLRPRPPPNVRLPRTHVSQMMRVQAFLNNILERSRTAIATTGKMSLMDCIILYRT